MTPAQFRERWTDHGYNEQQGAQRHFHDLCALVDFEPPHDAAAFTFEKQADKLSGGGGRADVWLRGHFGWEYKGPGADLAAAYRQLAEYREALENPPLLVVSDLDRVEIHTNFPNTIHQVHSFRTATIDESTLDLLRALFCEPERLNPKLTRENVTQDAARRVAEVFDELASRQVEPHAAAHFLMRIVFCLFAEDVRLLPPKLLTDLLHKRRDDPERLDRQIRALFDAMAHGGDFGSDEIDHFNGGLFDAQPTIRLTTQEIGSLARAAELDWSQVEPSIFGSLLEGALSHQAALRRRLGAHYTARSDIELIVDPVLLEPLRREWAQVQQACDQDVGRKDGPALVRKRLDAFKHRLGQIRVLDPACGSGNFLYVALAGLLDLEHEVHEAGARWGEQPGLVREVGPHQLYGFDLDPYAVELASITVWIGFLQWRHDHFRVGSDRPLLKPLNNIRELDAVVAPDGAEPDWPAVDVILGNPPFLGGKKLRDGLSDAYVDRLFTLYAGRVPREADLCCYWFEKARAQIAAGRAQRAGLLATNSIRQGPQMRPVLQKLLETGGIFMAWADRDWREDGAAVRVSMVGFDNGADPTRVLDGQPVETINADLTSGLDLSRARRLRENAGIAFMGDTKGGAFDITEEQARHLLAQPNPDGRSNADVVRPWFNGLDVMRRPRGMWIIDFGCTMPEDQAALYEAPYEYVRQHVRPVREGNKRASYAARWWLHVEPRPAMRAALAGLPRYLVTPTVAKHRTFVWCEPAVLPDHQLIAFATDDDRTFGVLQSSAHEIWALRNGSTLEDRPAYRPTACFETFPFPRPDEAQREAIAAAAQRLDELRCGALANDPKLTLTGLYNKRPTWLQHAHRALDEAVLAAYGWPADLGDEELLERLLALNLERAAEEAGEG